MKKNIIDKLFRHKKNIIINKDNALIDVACVSVPKDTNLTVVSADKKISVIPKLVQYDVTYQEAIKICQEKKLFIPEPDELELILRAFSVVPDGFIWTKKKNDNNNADNANNINNNICLCLAVDVEKNIFKSLIDENRKMTLLAVGLEW